MCFWVREVCLPGAPRSKSVQGPDALMGLVWDTAGRTPQGSPALGRPRDAGCSLAHPPASQPLCLRASQGEVSPIYGARPCPGNVLFLPALSTSLHRVSLAHPVKGKTSVSCLGPYLRSRKDRWGRTRWAQAKRTATSSHADILSCVPISIPMAAA